MPRGPLFEREPGWQFSLMLALEVVFLFAVVPAFSSGEADYSAVTLFHLILAGVAIARLAKSAWLRGALAISFGLTMLARLLPGLLPHITSLSMAFAYNLMVTVAMVKAVFGPGEVNHHRIAGAVFIYLNIAVLFALTYSELALTVPNALSVLPPGRQTNASEMIHLSFTTLTAIGNSPMSLKSPFAQSLSDLETIIGQLFPAILLSRLVGLHLSRAS